MPCIYSFMVQLAKRTVSTYSLSGNVLGIARYWRVKILIKAGTVSKYSLFTIQAKFKTRGKAYD